MRSRRLSRRGHGKPNHVSVLALIATALLAIQRRRQLLHANGQYGSPRRWRGGGQGAAREQERAQHGHASARKSCQMRPRVICCVFSCGESGRTTADRPCVLGLVVECGRCGRNRVVSDAPCLIYHPPQCANQIEELPSETAKRNHGQVRTEEQPDSSPASKGNGRRGTDGGWRSGR